MERRFPGLRTISVIYKVLSGIVALLTVLGSLAVSLAGMGAGGNSLNSPLGGLAAGSGILMAGAMLMYGLFISLTLWAFAEGIQLLLAMEENTRVTAEAAVRPAYHSPQ